MTETSATPDEFLAVIREILGSLDDFRPLLPLEQIVPAHHLMRDLGVDSVAMLDLGMGLEAHLGRAVDESELARLGTVEAVIQHLVAKAA